MTLSAGISGARLALPAARVPVRGSLRAMAAADEDAVTLGATAALRLLHADPTSPPQALLVATVSSPVAEGGCAQTIAEITGLAGPGLHVQEHGGTSAAGGSALVSAIALVKAGITPVLMVAVDTRRDAAGRPYGDGAVALLVTAEGQACGIRYFGSAAEFFPDSARRDGDDRVREADRSLLRFAPTTAHLERLADDRPRVLSRSGGPALERAGTLGCAGFLAATMLALGEGGAEAPFTVATSASGVTHAFEVTPGPSADDLTADATTVLASGTQAAAVPSADPIDGTPYTSAPRSWREVRQDLALEGVRCDGCGQMLYPPAPVCPVDGPGTKLSPVRLGHEGSVLTTTRDHVFPYGRPLSMAVVEVDTGGRFYGQVADADRVAVGDRVRLVPRRMYSAGPPAYFWKIAPASGGGA